MYERLKKQIEYAKNSLSARDMLYEAYGAVKTAYELKAITAEQFSVLNRECVAEGINNPMYF